MSLIVLSTILFGGCRIEDRFIFHPDHVTDRDPSHIGLRFEDVFFTTQDGLRLHGWFIPHQEARATLIWFHGNAGNISDRLLNIKLLHDRIATNIFIFDYRGYGRSEGTISEKGTYLDGAAAMKYLLGRDDAAAHRLILFGRSLGAAVAAEMAIQFNSLGLILESPFVSIREMARAIFPSLPIAWLLRTRFDTMEKVRLVKTPILVLHGDRDATVPFSQGKKVFEVASQPKKFYRIVGATHNDTFVVGGEEYYGALREFIEGALAADEKIEPSP
ncbi:MAG TPA: alpha/beta hydrolase [Candidatus Binatia bacterium]